MKVRRARHFREETLKYFTDAGQVERSVNHSGIFVGIRFRCASDGVFYPRENFPPLTGLVDTGADHLYVPMNVAEDSEIKHLMLDIEGVANTPTGSSAQALVEGSVRLENLEGPRPLCEARFRFRVLKDVRTNFLLVGLNALVALQRHLHVFAPEKSWGFGKAGLCLRKHPYDSREFVAYDKEPFLIVSAPREKNSIP